MDFCGVYLSKSEIPWPLDKLNLLPNLRSQPKDIHDQCVAWQIFEDVRSVSLPSLERVIVKLELRSCSDAWHLNNLIKLTDDQLQGCKVQLLEINKQKTRLLNVYVTETLVNYEAQDEYSALVRDKVQELYGAGGDYRIEIHAASANITPQGTATEVHHDSEPRISTTRGYSDTKSDQPLKLWIIWKASENRRLSTCYSDTASKLENLGFCGYLVQHTGESIMMPANPPHATLSLAPHFLYGQTFNVEGCARDPTSFGLELSAGSKPVEAIDAVLTCYKEGLQDSDPRIRAI